LFEKVFEMKEITMATATVSETSHNHPKTHDGDGSGNHTPGRKSKTRALAAAKRPKRHTHAGPTAGGLTTLAVAGIWERLTGLKGTGVQTAKAIKHHIVTNPKRSVLIAFGAGCLWARLRKWSQTSSTEEPTV
jgi:hypothetical protein